MNVYICPDCKSIECGDYECSDCDGAGVWYNAKDEEVECDNCYGSGYEDGMFECYECGYLYSEADLDYSEEDK